MKDASETTVYTTIASDGTIRWALHKMHVAPDFSYDLIKKKPFEFRVCSCIPQFSLWFKSCLGSDWDDSMLHSHDVILEWLLLGKR